MEEFINSRAFPLLTFLGGLLIGHRLSIGRDKRQEFNAAAEPIRSRLLAAAERARRMPPWPSELEVDRFAHCLPAWRRKRFLRAYQGYEYACEHAEKRNARNEHVSTDYEGMAAAARACLPYTVWR